MSHLKDNLSDLDLVVKIKNGDSFAFANLLNRYANLIRNKASAFYNLGLETDDLFQEGALGLFHAAITFDINRNVSFSSYAAICVNNKIVSAYITASRDKHSPLNQSIPLTSINTEEIQDSSYISNPEDSFIEKENFKRIKQLLFNLLSTLECKVLTLYFSGYSYDQIASELNLSYKSVDNALQRIRHKMKTAAIQF